MLVESQSKGVHETSDTVIEFCVTMWTPTVPLQPYNYKMRITKGSQIFYENVSDILIENQGRRESLLNKETLNKFKFTRVIDRTTVYFSCNGFYLEEGKDKPPVICFV